MTDSYHVRVSRRSFMWHSGTPRNAKEGYRSFIDLTHADLDDLHKKYTVDEIEKIIGGQIYQAIVDKKLRS